MFVGIVCTVLRNHAIKIRKTKDDARPNRFARQKLRHLLQDGRKGEGDKRVSSSSFLIQPSNHPPPSFTYPFPSPFFLLLCLCSQKRAGYGEEEKGRKEETPKLFLMLESLLQLEAVRPPIAPIEGFSHKKRCTICFPKK